MPKTSRCSDQDGVHCGWRIYCPACDWSHRLDLRWSFNGDYEKPTFGSADPGGTSSLLVRTNHPGWKSYDPATDTAVCHSQITGGKISYYDDCSHKFAGQTLDLPDLDRQDQDKV